MHALEAGWTLFAICEYDAGTGDTVRLDDRSEADAACSADGRIAPSRVFKVVEVP